MLTWVGYHRAANTAASTNDPESKDEGRRGKGRSEGRMNAFSGIHPRPGVRLERKLQRELNQPRITERAGHDPEVG